MAIDHDTLPGGCFVKQIKYKQNGFQLKPKLLAPAGFQFHQTATLLAYQGNILITSDPLRQNILEGILELQLRQDELKQDFEPVIKLLLQTVLK